MSEDLLSFGRLGFHLESIRDLYPFQSNFIQIEGLNYHYLDEGSGKPVLMLHGNPTWSFYYRNLVLGLKEKHRVIVPDHIGCGLSDKPQNYSYRLARHIENVLHLIHRLDLNDITLVVHDWGGMIGFGAAMQDPARFSRFVILNTGAFRLPESGSLSRRIGACRVPGFGKMAVRVFNAFARGASMMATVSGKMSKREKDALCAPYNSYQNRIATHRFVEDIPLEADHPSYARLVQIENFLPNFSHLPRQLIWGKQDFCFDDHFLARWKEIWPDMPVLELPDAGHYVLEDAKDEVLGCIQDFFERTEGNS